jgi:hypothetical protein
MRSDPLSLSERAGEARSYQIASYFNPIRYILTTDRGRLVTSRMARMAMRRASGPGQYFVGSRACENRQKLARLGGITSRACHRLLSGGKDQSFKFFSATIALEFKYRHRTSPYPQLQPPPPGAFSSAVGPNKLDFMVRPPDSLINFMAKGSAITWRPSIWWVSSPSFGSSRANPMLGPPHP